MWDPHQGFVNQSQETNRNSFLETTPIKNLQLSSNPFLFRQTGNSIDYLDPFLEREEVLPMSFLQTNKHQVIRNTGVGGF